MPQRALLTVLATLVGCTGAHPTEEAARGSALVSACTGAVISVADAEAAWHRAADAPLGCAATAETCEALTACTAASECTGPDACDGDTLVRCLDGVESRETCGGGCVEAGGTATCADREEACEATRCANESTLDVCLAGTHVVARSCRDRLGGGVCAVVDGAARCVPTAAECPDGRTECDGDDGRVCYAGVWVDYRCSDIGFTCQVPDVGMLRCIEP